MSALQVLYVVRTLINHIVLSESFDTASIRYRNIAIRILNILREENINEN